MRGSRPMKAQVTRAHSRRRPEEVGLMGAQPSRPPPVPEGLQPEMATVWQTLWRSRVAQSWDRESDLPALTRYIRLLDRWHRYDDVVREMPMVKGSKGQVRANPLAARIDALEAQIRALEEHLGLTPASRIRLGIRLIEGQNALQSLKRPHRRPSVA
jgi:P27 family predicted phage terminase small subunit